MIKVFHHNDLDGYASGYLVGKYYNGKDVKYYEMGYDTKFPLDNIFKEDTVYIVDYHVSPELFEEIQEKANNVVWIDHHISAINEYENYYKEREINITEAIDGYWKDGDSATLLTYKYLFSDDSVDIPTWVCLVDAWDTWKTDSPYYEMAEALNIAVQNILEINLIEQIDKNYDFLQECVEKGRIYIEYRDQWSEGFDKRYGFETEIELEDGTLASAYVLSIGNANSKFFREKIDQYDFCITQGFDGEKWNISIYSSNPDMDCSKIAKEFNGGGHRGAAGCTYYSLEPLFTKTNPLLKNL